MGPTTINCKTSHSAPRACKCSSASILPHCEWYHRKNTIQHTSQKWLKVTVSGIFLFQEKYLKQTGNQSWNMYILLKSKLSGWDTFFPKRKTCLMDFLDNAWEWSLLNTFILNFHVKTSFTHTIWTSSFMQQRLNTLFLNVMMTILLRRIHITI